VQQPQQKPREVKPDPIPTEKSVVQELAPKVAPTVQPVQQATSAPSPVQLDVEPDFKADYLNNPRPPYPMVARRMGYSGKVILDVEVLAEGRAGDVKLQKSSGFEILDKAALQTVKTWRFIPAKHFGQAVTQRFLVPINFSLEGNDA
jgi:protein TonB